MTVFTGEIQSLTIGGQTFEVSSVVTDELILGPSLMTGEAGSLAGTLAHRTSFQAEIIAGIRTFRMLATGRPRPPRAITKQLNRENRAARRDLVHAAGCVFASCITRMIGRDAESIALDPTPGRVSVPRSLRPLLGRYVGGGR